MTIWNRGSFSALLLAIASALPGIVNAQAVGKTTRIGYADAGPPGCKVNVRGETYLRSLRELGYVPGTNISIDRQCYAGDEQMRRVLRGFVAAKVDLILVGAPLPALTARDLTKEIPILCTSCGDPLANGLVSNLGRPGGNVTGFASLSAELVGKRLALLKEVVPSISRVAAVVNPDNPGTRPTLKALEDAGAALGLAITRVEFREMGHFEKSMQAAAATGAQAILIQDDPYVAPAARQIADVALRLRLPSSSGILELADQGVLMAYGPDRNDLMRRAGGYTDRILKGAKPGDLPFQQPTKFEFVVNLKTAKALGVAIAPEFLQRADRVIQ